MNAKEQDFLQQLRATFAVEAQEHLQVMATGLLALEKASTPESQRSLVETVFRAAHSLKGAARAVGLHAVESRCQSLEEVLASWKREGSAPSPDALDRVHRLLDAVTATLAAPNERAPASPSGPLPFAAAVTAAHPAEPPAAAATSALDGAVQNPGAPEETVRVGVAKLEARLLETQELLGVKLAAGQRVTDLLELGHGFEAWRKAWNDVEPAVRRLRQTAATSAGKNEAPGLGRVLEFFEWTGDYLRTMENRAATLVRTAEQQRYSTGKLIDDSLDGSKKLLLLPFSTISAAFPKLVRDLCRDQGKEAELVVRGDHIELDKRILEELKDPLIHLLRNSIDHGIESPGERRLSGKPARATIVLAVRQVSGSKVEVTFSDDGAGIDAARVRESVVALGLLSAEEAARLGEAETHALVFRSAVTTSPVITQLSGRGLGLAIVREKAQGLGGDVTVESRAGRGTSFRIVLPALRATFRGILVKAGGQPFIIPSTQVERVSRAKPEDVKTVQGRETISSGGRVVALARLADLLQLEPVKPASTPAASLQIIILGSGEQRVAFTVDAILDELEVLVKPLKKPLARVRNVAAATVLGSGQVVPILNVSDLLKSAKGFVPSPMPVRAEPKRESAKAVLVAEDSITSRMLIKGILESAGYRVKTAVDGLDAFALLRSEPFDLVVSDVEMPRLNGFDLTARIRADRKLAEIPVVLVTALESRHDRERGIDVGANAYLVKSSFDQSYLLEAIGRLI